jgi:hypothetical protein
MRKHRAVCGKYSGEMGSDVIGIVIVDSRRKRDEPRHVSHDRGNEHTEKVKRDKR